MKLIDVIDQILDSREVVIVKEDSLRSGARSLDADNPPGAEVYRLGTARYHSDEIEVQLPM